jgi:hypothetical protein
MANRPIIQNSTLTDENGVTALSVATGGAVTLGPSSGTVSHTKYGYENQINENFTGGAVRTKSTTPTKGITRTCYVDEFTNLSTTAWACAGDAGLTVGIFNFVLKNIDDDIATFTIHAGVEQGVTLKYTAVGGANCSISEGSEGVFSITGLGDGRTYTLQFATGSGKLSLKASTTATGTTGLYYERISIFNP